MNHRSRAAGAPQKGFTILQMVVTIAIVAVVSTFGFLGITTARAEFRLQSSARQLAIYLEKARADAIRRHASPTEKSSVQTFGPGTNTYVVSMDFGSGVVSSRTYRLEPGVTFVEVGTTISFDWRGRIPERWVYQLNNGRRSMPVDVSGSGDITVDQQHFPDELIPEVAISTVTGDTIPDPSPSPSQSPSPNPSQSPTPIPTATPTPSPGNGGGNGNGNGNPTPTPTPTPIPTPTPTPTPGTDPTPTPTPIPPCATTLSPNELSLSQSDTSKQTGTAVFTIANGYGERIISASQAGNGSSFVIGLSLVRITGSGSTTISVTTKQGAGNRGVFIINVDTSPACGTTQQLKVSVSN